ncbi:MAG: DUF5330 domain-containing protein [Xanthobacteraceae bacterium]
MRFLLRTAFWLTVVLVMLPSGGSQPTPNVNVSAGGAVSAARATVNDMGSFCDRQPEACTVGSQAAIVIGHRAQAGAKLVYEYLQERLGAPDEVTTTGKPAAASGSRASQHTLTPADLTPPWRGPQPTADKRGSR